MKNFYEQFKTPIVTIILIFLGLGVYTKVFGPIPFYINSVNTTQSNLFSSSGSGEITAIPDTATISVGVTKTAATVQDAQNQTNTVANKLITDLKALGITDKDIKTTNYSVNPNYNNPRPLGINQPIEQQTTGYEVTQNIEVKIKPIERANKVIDTATRDGANLVSGANFTFSDDSQSSLEQKATQMAVDDAKSKAQTLANAAGIHLRKIINVVSSGNNQPILPFASAQKTEDTSNPTNVTPGQSTVTIGVTIYYETY